MSYDPDFDAPTIGISNKLFAFLIIAALGMIASVAYCYTR